MKDRKAKLEVSETSIEADLEKQGLPKQEANKRI
jgi:hypothetical protein